MAVPKTTLWEIDPHTLAKHEILRLYLSAWFPILGQYNQTVLYVDGFSGPGRYKNGEDGSPIIALKEGLKYKEILTTTHLRFLFIDERLDRITHLEQELTMLPKPNNFSVYVGNGSFDEEIKPILEQLNQSKKNPIPTFAFIDPFGFKGFPFSTVNNLLTNNKTEIFVNLMADAINRFLEHPDEQITQHIIEAFGTNEVLEIAKKGGDRITKLRLLYQQQLRNCARFVRYFEMRDDKNRPIYYLFFATNHPLGHVKMKESFWKVDPQGGFKFSDATNPNQQILFEMDTAAPTLADLLQEKYYLHQRVKVEEIEQFVNDETAFIRSHMVNALKLLENDNKIQVDSKKQDGKTRSKGVFSNEVIVNFVERPPQPPQPPQPSQLTLF